MLEPERLLLKQFKATTSVQSILLTGLSDAKLESINEMHQSMLTIINGMINKEEKEMEARNVRRN